MPRWKVLPREKPNVPCRSSQSLLPSGYRSGTVRTTRSREEVSVADGDGIRPELTELRARIAATLDEGRPDAVARRRKTGQRTARENIADLIDAGTFVEYGGLAVAAQ